MPTTSRAKDELNHGGVIFKVRWVISSNVDWVAWPSKGEPLMLVKFKGDEIYVYIGVSRQRVVAAAHHPSTGEYINQRIKPNFEVVKLSG
jgi:hypothetical protein